MVIEGMSTMAYETILSTQIVVESSTRTNIARIGHSEIPVESNKNIGGSLNAQVQNEAFAFNVKLPFKMKLVSVTFSFTLL